MAGEKSYLQWHGNQWRVAVKVPEKAQAVLGCKVMKRGLGTASLAEANRLKWDVVADMKRQIHEALGSTLVAAHEKPDRLVTEALEWRRQIQEEENDPDFDTEARVPASELVTMRAEEIETVEGLRRAKAFNAVALGIETPINSLVDAWLREQKVTPRSVADYRRALGRFVAWCSASKIPATIEKISRKIAGRFVSEAFIATRTDPKTTNKYVSSLSSYWRWLIKRGHCEANPWTGQSVAKAKAHMSADVTEKRPFSDEEVRALLTATVFDADKATRSKARRADVWDALPDVMRIAAFSGMRIEEIARLTVADCAGGVFDVHKAKSPAGRRAVPIHPEVLPIIARRTEHREDSAFLIHELKTPEAGSKSERSMPLVKAFVVYRRGLGVDDRPEGARQSRIDFHSFRRWFVTKAEMAGQPPHIISSVVGHEVGRQGMTLSVYSSGPSHEQKKQCVEAVRLIPQTDL